MEEFATERGNGERGLREQSGVPVDFQAFQEIEIGLVGLLAESLSNTFAAARRIFGEGTRTAAGILSDVIKAGGDVGVSFTSSVRDLAKGAVSATDEVLRDGI